MNEPLENAYFRWLCAKIIEDKYPNVTYNKLFNILHRTEFVWLLVGDDNRAEDGIELRTEFILECEIPDNPGWRGEGCSLLEMLIAFSRRARFLTDIPSREWFWEFLDNLRLSELSDSSDFDTKDVENILDDFIWRTYSMKGEGGILPLNSSNNDQRHVEIWYQFCEYVVDKNKIP